MPTRSRTNNNLDEDDVLNTTFLPQQSASTLYDSTFHGTNIAEVMDFMKKLLNLKASAGQKLDLNKQEMQAIVDYVYMKESSYIHDGVNFSRIQIEKILTAQAEGKQIEFETLGPYLASYMDSHGKMTHDNLLPEDAIGLQVAATLRKQFPSARLISLYDDYNNKITYKNTGQKEVVSFTEASKKNLVSSLESLLRIYQAIPSNAVNGKDFLFIKESEKVKDAEIMVKKLDALGNIAYKGNVIFFVNSEAENQLYRKIQLRTIHGKWLCEALDAATFLKEENLHIVHIVVLPEYMKPQQDKVWEILKVLDIQPANYHNIFFDESRSPQEIAQVIEAEFKRVKQKMTQNN